MHFNMSPPILFIVDSVITLPKTVEPEASARASTNDGNENSDVVYTILEDHGYFVIERIGSGSFSKVKKAHSQKEHKIVAIKLVSKSRAPKDYLEKFLPREIDVVKGLDHPNIIKYYRCIETTRRVYIIMQYAENGSLLDRIRGEGQLSETLARHIYHQLVAAIDYCHRRGVVHRDIKCENLLFDKHDVLKLIDFGFARKFQVPGGRLSRSCLAASRTSLTKGTTTTTTVSAASDLSDTYCGSYAYACPQILRGTPYDPHFADVWASGVVLFAMVFGRLPFDDSSFARLLKQVSAKLNFSTKGSRQVSELCKAFLNHVLVRTGTRSIKSVREHPWMLTPEAPHRDSLLGDAVKVGKLG